MTAAICVQKSHKICCVSKRRSALASGLLFLLISISTLGTLNGFKSEGPNGTYRYFCYGSNVLPSTMENLRGLRPVAATAAVLPGFTLRFDGMENSKLEPSAAFVLETGEPDDTVHGVLYTLTADDFATVGFTEGVPFSYRWRRCRVFPYVGVDGKDVGSEILGNGATKAIEAVTLVTPKKTIEKDIPPSSSYLGIIRAGAKYWKLDSSYQDKLAQVPSAKNLIIPGGLSGPLLRLAEFFR